MKRTMLFLLLGTALGAHGGETYLEPAPLGPAPVSSDWQWFIGGSGGYLLDAEEDFWTGHIGVELLRGDHSHAIYLEVGYGDFDESDRRDYDGPDRPPGTGTGTQRVKLDIDVEIIPVSLNYKYERTLSGKFSWYFGAGAGMTFADVDVDAKPDVGKFEGDDDTTFYAQGFGGIIANISENFEIFGGARWIYFDQITAGDVDLNGDDDVLIELGARFTF